ncbi:MAG: kelch repeat-containing protein, partial [Planctomycetota bacterium]
ATSKIEPEIPPDPGVVKTLESLEAGCSAVLPRPKVTGDITETARRFKLDKLGPCGRDYCIKMLWMPDRKRAAFGGANHGGPGRLNDIWEYDLAGNTWVCLYGPDMSKDNDPAHWKDVTVDENGIFRCKRGGPANVGHLWWQITYDTERRAIAWICRWGSDAPFAKALPGKMGGRLPDCALWLYYPYERKWEPVTGSKIVGDKHPGTPNASALEYIPDLKRYLWMRQDGMTWSYNAATNTWTDMKPNGGSLKRGDQRSHSFEATTVYVPSRKILVSAGCNRPRRGEKKWTGRTNVYDIPANTWKKVADGDGVPVGHDSWAPFVYDSVADVCLMFQCKEKQLYVFDIDGAKWSKLAVKGPPVPGHNRLQSYYDPARNVWVIHSHRGDKVWVYRHKRRAPSAAAARGDG